MGGIINDEIFFYVSIIRRKSALRCGGENIAAIRREIQSTISVDSQTGVLLLRLLLKRYFQLDIASAHYIVGFCFDSNKAEAETFQSAKETISQSLLPSPVAGYCLIRGRANG